LRSRKLSRGRRRTAIVTAAAASVVAGAALLPNWSAGAATAGAESAVAPSTRATFQRLADAVFTDRTDALVQSGKRGDTPLASRFPGDVRLSSALSHKENAALSQLRGRKSRLASLGEKYNSADWALSPWPQVPE
jgi:hypothetical protein